VAARPVRQIQVTGECDNLDAFLLDDLRAEAAARFTSHLHECDECRESVDRQRWIDGALKSSLGAALERAPIALNDSLRTSPSSRRQHARLIACGLATLAAAIAVAVGWTAKLNRQAEHGPQPGTNSIAKQEGDVPDIVTPAIVNDAKRPHATFVSSQDAIAVPIESAEEDVTIVRLYPTTETERRMEHELLLQTIQSEFNGG
jgi:anti-sigma factor RsiW